MIIAFIVMVFVLWTQTKIVGCAVLTEPAVDYRVKDFESVEDAMEYGELCRNGWHGSIKDYYEWKEEE